MSLAFPGPESADPVVFSLLVTGEQSSHPMMLAYIAYIVIPVIPSSQKLNPEEFSISRNIPSTSERLRSRAVASLRPCFHIHHGHFLQVKLKVPAAIGDHCSSHFGGPRRP